MGKSQVQASVLHGAKDLRLESVELPEPAAGEVQVAIKSTGLCGSDLHYYTHGRNGDIVMREPLILGHESAGIVTAVGADVSSLRVGDRVALEVGVPCGSCANCTSGRYNLCPKMRFRSSAKIFPHFQGTLQERINHPAHWCWRLPDELSLDHGALIEPLSVAAHALDRAGLGADGNNKARTALVWGAGAVGLLVAAALAFSRPDIHVVVGDVDEGRLKFAEANRFGRKTFIVPMKRAQDIDGKLEIAKSNAETSKEALKSSIEASQGHPYSDDGYDAVFECTGQEICLQSSIYAANPGGKVMMIGMGTPIQTLPLSAAALREVDLIGVFRYHDTYPKCIQLVQKAIKDLESGKTVPDISKLVTHKFNGFSQVSDAFQAASRPVDEDGNSVLKIIVET